MDRYAFNVNYISVYFFFILTHHNDINSSSFKIELIACHVFYVMVARLSLNRTNHGTFSDLISVPFGSQFNLQLYYNIIYSFLAGII